MTQNRVRLGGLVRGLVGGLVAVLFLGPFSQAKAAVCGQIAGVKGTQVEILRLQRDRQGDLVRHAMKIEEKKAAEVHCDDIVLTGKDSSAKIILSTSKLSLGPDSRIELAEYTGSKRVAEPKKVNLIHLTYGKVRTIVNSKKESEKKSSTGPQSQFRVRTFSAVSGVRGTDFFMSYEPNSGTTEQATLEGSVEVQQYGSNQKVVVSGGQQVAVEITPQALEAAKAEAEGRAVPLIENSDKIKPIVIMPIQDVTKNEIRLISAVAKDDLDFIHPKALEILGKPDTWTIEREKPPEGLRDLKNEF
jgi:hypothetical protein